MKLSRLIDEIKTLEVEPEKEKDLKTISKIIKIYREWDGNPETLDVESFTEEEIQLAIDHLDNHQESGLNYGLLNNDLFSIVITAQNLMIYLAVVQAPISKEVVYI